MPGTALGNGESAVKKIDQINKSLENKIILDVGRMVKQRRLGNGMLRDLGSGEASGKVSLRRCLS